MKNQEFYPVVKAKTERGISRKKRRKKGGKESLEGKTRMTAGSGAELYPGTGTHGRRKRPDIHSTVGRR